MNDDLTAVIRAADEALYNAKATGRNKVSAAEV
jgi:PleD family two-component response regulator